MSYITINKQNFFHNLSSINKHVGDKSKIAIVLKDNAYGHGLELMAKLSHEYGVQHAVVRTNSEATKIAKLFNTVLVLADCKADINEPNIHLAINDLSDLKSLARGSKIELKFDTGMHRNGLKPDEMVEALSLIQQNALSLKGIFTHHRSADVLSSEHFWQEHTFQRLKFEAKELLKSYGMPEVRFHSQNSAATMRASSHDDIVRVGISAYGLLELPLCFGDTDFKPLLSLWAEKLHTFESPAYARHGYEAKGLLDQNSTLSTYDIGYADGLLRLSDETVYSLSNQSKIIGRISMDNIIINSSEGSLCIYDDARVYAKSAQTISYEVVVRLAPEIERKVI
jgi:alanine racemase